MTKKERQRIYDATPERKAARRETTRIWRLNNPDKVKAMDARKKAKKKTAYYSIYYLPEEHYVGITNQIDLRILNHSCKGKITVGCEIICEVSSKKEALQIERFFHSIGYIGAGHLAKIKLSKNLHS